MNAYDACVLVVEDDKQIRSFIGYSLENAGLSYLTASTAQAAMSMLVSEKVDIMLLDLGLPDFDGMEVIHKVRQWSEIPIIVVSARDQDKDKAAALDAGADDYLTKPFSATELLARVRVALRHLYQLGSRERSQNAMQVGGLQIDLDKRLLHLDGQEVHLTPLEYDLMRLLFTNMGKVLTTKQILKEVWGIDYGTDTQALRALMAGLRRKVEKNPANPRYIITEIGVGYRLVDE